MSDEQGMDISSLLKLLGPGIVELLSGREIELENVELELGELELWLPMGGIPNRMGSYKVPQGLVKDKEKNIVHNRPDELIPELFESKADSYPSRIREVTLGGTRADGGTRGNIVTVGGAASLPFSHPDITRPNSPVISLDVFDTRLPMPKALKGHLIEVIDDPAAWAKMNVEQFGADMVTVHLISTDPLIKDTSPKQASKVVEEVLQAVDVPVIIGGCGDPKKDAQTFIEIAEMAEGERLLLNSVTKDMADAKTLEPVCKAADKFGHCLLGFTGLDLNSAKELNRRIYPHFPADRLLMDLTSVALGYGLEYSFSIHERVRISALLGDYELQHPTISACTNAWSAREAWMDLGPDFGKSEIRGPLWESLGGITLLLAGVDLFMMMHPLAISTMREVSAYLMHPGKMKPEATDWISLKY